MKDVYLFAKTLQLKVYHFLSEENEWTDVGEWLDFQTRIISDIERLVWMKGESPDVEAERLLAILMGYTITVRNGHYIGMTLESAEKLLPCISDMVLKCHLMIFCFAVCYDDSLCEDVENLIDEIKRSGRGEEILKVEQLFESMKENSGITY